MTQLLRLAAAALVGFAIFPAAVVAGSAEFTVTLTDGVIDPQIIEVPAGQAVTLTVTNAGTSVAEFESKRLRIEKLIPPGKTISIKLRALPADIYPFVEEFHENLDTAQGTIVAQ